VTDMKAYHTYLALQEGKPDINLKSDQPSYRLGVRLPTFAGRHIIFYTEPVVSFEEIRDQALYLREGKLGRGVTNPWPHMQRRDNDQSPWETLNGSDWDSPKEKS